MSLVMSSSLRLALNPTLTFTMSLVSRLISIHYQITLSFPTILLFFIGIIGTISFLIRYKYLSKYSTNPNENLRPNDDEKDDIVDSIQKRKSRNVNGTSNYLDEFLSAIKIFGYLERPVFHELTKNMTTQKLSWDEILYLDEKLGFLIVVDGSVQVFIKITDNYNTSDSQKLPNWELDRDDVLIIGNQKYQLLNEIKSGVPLSSLKSTLDLFNNNDDESLDPHNVESTNSISSASSLDLNKHHPHQTYPEIVARPKSGKRKRHGATIAIIPNLAFQRIQYKYPKATAHIVTMVKNRLFKVTMNTIHNYMGLTDEIIDTESKLNANTSKLPLNLGPIIDRYKVDDESPDDSTLSVSSSTISRKNTTLNLQLEFRPSRQASSTRLVFNKPNHPGDLLSSVPVSRKSILHFDFQNNPNIAPQSQSLAVPKEQANEMLVKVSVINELFKLLGVKQEALTANKMAVSSSGMMSSSSSANGLSSLVNSDNPMLLNSLDKGQIYDNYAGRARFDSVSSIGSSSTTRAASPKIYNTISQAQLNAYNSHMRGSNIAHIDDVFDFNQRTKSNSTSTKATLDFDSIKKEFAQCLTIKWYDAGSTVIEQDCFNCGLYYVVYGSLDVEYTTVINDKPITRPRQPIQVGGVAGYLSTLIGIKSLTAIKTPNDSGAILAHISKKDWTNLNDKYYQFSLPLATKMKSLFTKQFSTIDFALEYCMIEAGEVLAAEGDEANGFHIIVSGRFRVVKSNESGLGKDNFTVLGEYGHGESIGEVEVLTASRRSLSLIAVRDSEIARIPRTLFEILSSVNPSIMVKVSRIVANKVASAQNDIQALALVNPNISIAPVSNSTPFKSPSSYISSNYKTITILPTVNGLPVREFASKLIGSLKAIGRNVISLDQASILAHLGRHAFDDSLAHLKLSGYFASLEEEYETVVYICDSTLKSSWTSTCISQGDCILLLANAEDYEVALGTGDYERLLIKYKTTARTDLCLLHPDKYVPHGSTSLWLKNRSWVQGHHHIQMIVPNSLKGGIKKKSLISDLAAKLSEAANNSQLRTRLDVVRSRFKSDRPGQTNDISLNQSEPYKNDFLRLARLLSNEAIGLVLGGGGARGISHLGVVTALEKHGIPIDIIGGTSIGAFVGGLYATEYNSVSIYGKVKKFSKRIGSMWRSVLDLTFPVTSYLTGHEFNRGIWKALGFVELEDSWIKFYCNSTNITNSTMDIHETGYLWRFIRASMSLAGLLPPIAYDGCMLLDGGYLDNLPVLEMKKRGIKYIIAVDVGSIDDRSPMNYGDTLSGLWVILNRWNPFSKHANVPNMMDIQSRLAYVASVNALETAKRTPGVKYLRPPIDQYATLDFGKFQEIYTVGLNYGEEMVSKWEQNDSLPDIVKRMNSKSKRGPNQPLIFRRNSL